MTPALPTLSNNTDTVSCSPSMSTNAPPLRSLRMLRARVNQKRTMLTSPTPNISTTRPHEDSSESEESEEDEEDTQRGSSIPSSPERVDQDSDIEAVVESDKNTRTVSIMGKPQQNTLKTSQAIYVPTEELEPVTDPSATLVYLFPEGNISTQSLNHEDWNIRFHSLLLFRQLCKYHCNLLLPYLRIIIRHLCTESENLRSALSKHALLALLDLFSHMNIQYVTSVSTFAIVLPILLQTLVRRAADASDFISSTAIQTLRMFVSRLTCIQQQNTSNTSFAYDGAEFDVQVIIRLFQQMLHLYKGPGVKLSTKMKGIIFQQLELCMNNLSQSKQETSLSSYLHIFLMTNDGNIREGTLAVGSTLRERTTVTGMLKP